MQPIFYSPMHPNGKRCFRNSHARGGNIVPTLLAFLVFNLPFGHHHDDTLYLRPLLLIDAIGHIPDQIYGSGIYTAVSFFYALTPFKIEVFPVARESVLKKTLHIRP